MLEKYQTLKSFLNIHNEQQIIKLVIILASYPKIIPQIKSQRTATVLLDVDPQTLLSSMIFVHQAFVVQPWFSWPVFALYV